MRTAWAAASVPPLASTASVRGTRTTVGASVAPHAADGHTLDVGAYLTMAVLLDGVLDPRRANPVNA